MKKKSGQMDILKRVLKCIRPHGVFVVLSLAMAVVSVVLTLYLPVLTGRIVDLIIGPDAVDFAAILDIMKIMAAAILVTALAQWLMNICNNRIVYHVSCEVREQAFRKIEILPLQYLDTHSSGETVSRVIADVDQFSDGLLMGFTQLFTGVVTIMGTLFFMLSVNAGITLVVVVLTPVSLLVANFIAKRTYAMFRKQSETRGEQTALIDEMIGNQKVVQAYGQEAHVQEQFNEVNKRLSHYSLRAIFFSSLTNPCTRFVNSLVYTGVGLTGALSVVRGLMTVGQLSAFLSYANQYTKPFNEISGVVTELQNALACAGRIFELIDAEAETPDTAALLASSLNSSETRETGSKANRTGIRATGSNAKRTGTSQSGCEAKSAGSRQLGSAANPVKSGLTADDIAMAVALPPNPGAVTLSHVDFSYTKERPLIEDFNLSVRPGQRVAIVGPTGCGKTTLINLLMRFYDVDGGSIAIEGRDIRRLARRDLRSAYGMVLQDTWLRAGTIRENISMGRPDATEEEIIQAAKESHAHSFIRRLPQGYDTVIGENGGNLSQGQKQLLCIARVMLTLPPMLILDEATSSIDTRTEIRIQQAFQTMMQGRTSFIVAHRLSTIQNADVILVMKDGHIIEQGTHRELLEKAGFYAELYNSQFVMPA
ncbi:MAG: ABC transporter ATP-binding protein/permease [Lachnospiraceae bacterium]|nr:ABC transporter ATP-binding protein/permease [Lachnospiraceae bacterium]